MVQASVTASWATLNDCAVLLHLIDAATQDAAAAYRTVRGELEQYGAGLTTKAEVVAISKSDEVDEEALEQQRTALAEASGGSVLALSSHARTGLDAAVAVLAEHVSQTRQSEKPARGAR